MMSCHSYGRSLGFEGVVAKLKKSTRSIGSRKKVARNGWLLTYILAIASSTA